MKVVAEFEIVVEELEFVCGQILFKSIAQLARRKALCTALEASDVLRGFDGRIVGKLEVDVEESADPGNAPEPG